MNLLNRLSSIGHSWPALSTLLILVWIVGFELALLPALDRFDKSGQEVTWDKGKLGLLIFPTFLNLLNSSRTSSSHLALQVLTRK